MSATLESPEQDDVVELIAELDRYQTALYPPQSNHLLDLASLKQPNVLFAVARDVDGGAIGCGSVVLSPPAGELKRMVVRASFRNRGVAKAILSLLENEASKAGCTLLRLETGIHQHEALGLYERSGYGRCGPFADYADDPLSVFMQKRIAA
jgi:putative acetyltransferase